jgi:hypothetical protein
MIDYHVKLRYYLTAINLDLCLICSKWRGGGNIFNKMRLILPIFKRGGERGIFLIKCV